MNPVEYNQIEHGYIPYPTDEEWFEKICRGLDISLESPDPNVVGDYIILRGYWEKPFVMQKMNEDILISPFVCTTEGVPLTKEKMIEVQEYLVDYAKKHNKEAEKYNKEHGVS